MIEIEFYETETGDCPVSEYLDSLLHKQAEKIVWTFDLIQSVERVPKEYLKKLKNTDDIWEVRVQQSNNIFRVLGFFDENKLMILNHAFTKKTQKTPKNEIKKSEKRKHEYYNRRLR